jgi:hypothetical protein
MQVWLSYPSIYPADAGGVQNALGLAGTAANILSGKIA